MAHMDPDPWADPKSRSTLGVFYTIEVVESRIGGSIMLGDLLFGASRDSGEAGRKARPRRGRTSEPQHRAARRRGPLR